MGINIERCGCIFSDERKACTCIKVAQVAEEGCDNYTTLCRELPK